jgi:hypothetical protein
VDLYLSLDQDLHRTHRSRNSSPFNWIPTRLTPCRILDRFQIIFLVSLRTNIALAIVFFGVSIGVFCLGGMYFKLAAATANGTSTASAVALSKVRLLPILETFSIQGALATHAINILSSILLLLSLHNFHFISISYTTSPSSSILNLVLSIQAGGAFLFISACSGFYLVIVQLSEAVEMPFKLPVGELGRFWVSRKKKL